MFFLVSLARWRAQTSCQAAGGAYGLKAWASVHIRGTPLAQPGPTWSAAEDKAMLRKVGSKDISLLRVILMNCFFGCSVGGDLFETAMKGAEEQGAGGGVRGGARGGRLGRGAEANPPRLTSP